MATMTLVKRFMLVGMLGLALGASACGGDDSEKAPGTEESTGADSYDNYQACKNWVASINCGSFDPSTTVACDTFKQITTCDVSDYFDCLTANFKCTSGMPDPSGWSQCMSKASCH